MIHIKNLFKRMAHCKLLSSKCSVDTQIQAEEIYGMQNCAFQDCGTYALIMLFITLQSDR